MADERPAGNYHILKAAQAALRVLREAELTKEEAFAAMATMSAVLMAHSQMADSQVEEALSYMRKTTRALLPETREGALKATKAVGH